LAGLVEDVLLPFLKMKRNYRGKVIERLVPLFPCYLFVFFDLKSAQHSIRRTFGVIDLISAGNELLEVDRSIVAAIRQRGVVEMPLTLCRGQHVQVIEGPMRGLVAVFERFLPGSERVALLLNAMGITSVRVTLPSSQVTPLAVAIMCAATSAATSY
jgi:transcriptional antiterminator RfaH